MSPVEGATPVAAAGATAVAKGIPEATVARLPGYLRALNHLSDNGVATVSSGDLADEAGVNPAQLRKDLSHLGSYGTRGVGYSVAYLRFQIGREIGSAVDWPVIIIGVGNLGTALAQNADFGSRGFRVVALVDTNSALVGTEIDGLTIEHQDDLRRTLRDSGARIAVITTPPDSAQAVCDELVACGITSILNFAATVLSAPHEVTVRKVDLGQELQILAYHEQRKLDGLWPADDDVVAVVAGEAP
ncbi:MAG: redox-sensing transcriptional repressor Rex [Propionibacteriales bacterium]|nr:redox-sensing transcriptional repressor Rex [Propionibacteriales bacterium]